VCFWSPPVHERGDQRGVLAKPRQLLRPGNLMTGASEDQWMVAPGCDE
jgi:hypothetical protein